MKKFLAIGAAALSASCATIYNSHQTAITIITNEPARLETQDASFSDLRVRRSISVPRSYEPLSIRVFNDSISKSVDVKSTASLAYYANILWGFGAPAGLLIDLVSPKWRGYPPDIYIDMRTADDKYFTYDIFEKSKYSNIITWTPLRMLDFYNPAVEFTYERCWALHTSTQIMLSYLLPESVTINWFAGYADVHNYIGFKAGLEQKLYVRPTAPLGFYLSAEANYLRARYDQYISGYSGWSYNEQTDIFSVRKQMLTFNFKFGYQWIINHFTIDAFIGLGMRYIKVEHGSKAAWNNATYTGFFTADILGTQFRSNLPFNLRLGWAF